MIHPKLTRQKDKEITQENSPTITLTDGAGTPKKTLCGGKCTFGGGYVRRGYGGPSVEELARVGIQGQSLIMAGVAM